MNARRPGRVDAFVRCSLALLLASSLAATPAWSQVPPSALPADGAIDLSDEAAEGTNVRRGVSRFVVRAPMREVVDAFTDYAHYTELLPRVSSARVVRRTRAGTEVYLQVALGGNLGVLWSRVRVAVRRSPTQVTVEGTSLEGNVDRFEFSARIQPVEGDPARCLVECRMLSVPQLPFPSTVFSRENRHALATMANQLRNRLTPPTPAPAPEAPAGATGEATPRFPEAARDPRASSQ